MANQHEQEDHQEVSIAGEVPPVPGQRDRVGGFTVGTFPKTGMRGLLFGIHALHVMSMKQPYLSSKTVLYFQGNISRQEAVSMIPPLLMKIEPNHKVRRNTPHKKNIPFCTLHSLPLIISGIICVQREFEVPHQHGTHSWFVAFYPSFSVKQSCLKLDFINES